GLHLVEVPERPLQRGEHREPGGPRRLVALLHRQLRAHPAAEQQPVAVERPVAGDVRDIPAYEHRLEWQPQALRRDQPPREVEAHLSQAILYRAHGWRMPDTLAAMRLGEALARRSDLQKRIAQLTGRLQASAVVQEGDVPPEDPGALLRDLG